MFARGRDSRRRGANNGSRPVLVDPVLSKRRFGSFKLEDARISISNLGSLWRSSRFYWPGLDYPPCCPTRIEIVLRSQKRASTLT